MAEIKKEKKLTVFKSDRHEDWAAILFTAIVVGGVLFYMAFLVGTIPFKAPAAGKILSVKVVEQAQIQAGDPLFVLETTEKKMVHGALEEKVVQKEIKAKAPGQVVKVGKKDGDAVKKDEAVLIIEPVKGTLP